MATASDIVLVLTGGSGNSNPNLSLGGEPSATPITGVLNNLFDNISEATALSGQVDYRCIYLFNNNSIDNFYNVKLYLDSIVGSNTNVQLGITSIDEKQTITITGPVTGGSFTVTFAVPGNEAQTINPVAYNPDPSLWGGNLQAVINSIPFLSGAEVVVSGDFSARVFNIKFADSRNHDLTAVDVFGLTGGSITGSVAKVAGGSPINAIPPLLDVATTPPAGVAFFSPTIASPIEIGTLHPEEGLPIWIKRNSPASAVPASGDGFTLKIAASPISS